MAHRLYAATRTDGSQYLGTVLVNGEVSAETIAALKEEDITLSEVRSSLTATQRNESNACAIIPIPLGYVSVARFFEKEFPYEYTLLPDPVSDLAEDEAEVRAKHVSAATPGFPCFNGSWVFPVEVLRNYYGVD